MCAYAQVNCRFVNHENSSKFAKSIEMGNWSAPFGDSITINCKPGYITFAGGTDACQASFSPKCQADTTFDSLQDEPCIPRYCRAYITIDPNIAQESQALSPSGSGQIMKLRCKKGYGLNLSSVPASRYFTAMGPDYVFDRTCNTTTCSWFPGDEMCVPVPCRCNSYATFLSSQGTRSDGKLYPMLHSDEADEDALPGTVKKAVCPIGYDSEFSSGTNSTITCSSECTYSTNVMCRPKECTWHSDFFSVTAGLESIPADGKKIQFGETLEVQCASGYQLADKLPVTEPEFKTLTGLEALGTVKVLQTQSFPAPNRTEKAIYALSGEYSAVTLELPPGAWPENLQQGPSIAVFELPASRRRAGTVAGKAVSFGPDGTQFSSPVTISCPVDSNFDAGNRQLQVHRYNPSTGTTPVSWTKLPYPDGYEVPSGAVSAVKGTTMSFSAYAVLAVDPPSSMSSTSLPTPPPTTPEPSTSTSSTSSSSVTVKNKTPLKPDTMTGPLIIVLGVITGLVIVGAIGAACYYGNKSSKKEAPTSVANWQPYNMPRTEPSPTSARHTSTGDLVTPTQGYGEVRAVESDLVSLPAEENAPSVEREIEEEPAGLPPVPPRAHRPAESTNPSPPPRYREISVSQSVAARTSPSGAPIVGLHMPGGAIRDDTSEFDDDEFDDIPVSSDVRPGFDRGFA